MIIRFHVYIALLLLLACLGVYSVPSSPDWLLSLSILLIPLAIACAFYSHPLGGSILLFGATIVLAWRAPGSIGTRPMGLSSVCLLLSIALLVAHVRRQGTAVRVGWVWVPIIVLVVVLFRGILEYPLLYARAVVLTWTSYGLRGIALVVVVLVAVLGLVIVLLRRRPSQATLPDATPGQDSSESAPPAAGPRKNTADADRIENRLAIHRRILGAGLMIAACLWSLGTLVYYISQSLGPTFESVFPMLIISWFAGAGIPLLGCVGIGILVLALPGRNWPYYVALTSAILLFFWTYSFIRMWPSPEFFWNYPFFLGMWHSPDPFLVIIAAFAFWESLLLIGISKTLQQMKAEQHHPGSAEG